MKIFNNEILQKVSWIKSNKSRLSQEGSITNLYYPENLEEFKELLSSFVRSNLSFDIIGYASNTLFLPTYRVENLICTIFVKDWYETETSIICDCGVNVSQLSKAMIEKGYKGFEGLTDLPGTIAAAVYGNCGCRGCSVLDLVESFSIMNSEGIISTLHVSSLMPSYRSTTLKRKELKGVILSVCLKKKQGDRQLLKSKAEENHRIRLAQQPSAANNLGTTINGGAKRTLKGLFFIYIEKLISILTLCKDRRNTFPILLKITGNSRYIPYIYYWNRYMFLDEKAHELFPEYFEFIKTLYKDARLEIEIRE